MEGTRKEADKNNLGNGFGRYSLSGILLSPYRPAAAASIESSRATGDKS